MIWPWLNRQAWLTDVTVTAFLLVAGLGAVVHNANGTTVAILTAAGTVPLVVRRRWPLLVLAIATVCSLALIPLHAWIVPLPVAVALYTLTSIRDSRLARVEAGVAIFAIAVAVLVDGGVEFGAAAARVVLLVAAALLGDNVRSRRAYVSAIEEKAARLERERETQAQRAAAQEQARIARELHDVVAHALSVIVVQAGAADDAFEFDPARAREPIRAVDNAARAALADLRRVLGIVQDGEYEPQPSLVQLDHLVDSVRATGIDVELEIDGRRRALPAAVDLSAYRIVQEALTNTLKHAAAAHVRVRVSYGRELELEVRDDGRGVAKPSNGGGNGLVGMRERVALLGGRLDAGPASGGGYRIAAAIPLEPVA